MFTLPETKISSEKWPSQKRFHLPTIDFCEAMSVSGSARAQPPGKLAVNVLLPTRAPSEIRLVLLWAVSPLKTKTLSLFQWGFCPTVKKKWFEKARNKKKVSDREKVHHGFFCSRYPTTGATVTPVRKKDLRPQYGSTVQYIMYLYKCKNP